MAPPYSAAREENAALRRMAEEATAAAEAASKELEQSMVWAVQASPWLLKAPSGFQSLIVKRI